MHWGFGNSSIPSFGYQLNCSIKGWFLGIWLNTFPRIGLFVVQAISLGPCRGPIEFLTSSHLYGRLPKILNSSNSICAKKQTLIRQWYPRTRLFVAQAISVGACRRPIEFLTSSQHCVCQKSQIVEYFRSKNKRIPLRWVKFLMNIWALWNVSLTRYPFQVAFQVPLFFIELIHLWKSIKCHKWTSLGFKTVRETLLSSLKCTRFWQIQGLTDEKFHFFV